MISIGIIIALSIKSCYVEHHIFIVMLSVIMLNGWYVVSFKGLAYLTRMFGDPAPIPWVTNNQGCIVI